MSERLKNDLASVSLGDINRSEDRVDARLRLVHMKTSMVQETSGGVAPSAALTLVACADLFEGDLDAVADATRHTAMRVGNAWAAGAPEAAGGANWGIRIAAVAESRAYGT